MQGLTLYLNAISAARKFATDEQFGRLCKLALDMAENGSEETPKFENVNDAIFFEGFLHCLKTSRIKSKNGKKGGAPEGNQNARKNTVEKRSMEDIDNNGLQLLLAELEKVKPQKNQSIQMLLWNSKDIAGCIEKNKINKQTQEEAWKIYTNAK